MGPQARTPWRKGVWLLMAQIKLWLANRALNCSYTVTTGAENASYPFSNAIDEDRLTVFKPNTIATTVIRIDLGAAYTIEGWAVSFHTLGTQTAAASLDYSAADNGAAATGDTNADGKSFTTNNNYVKAFAAASKRYWWVSISAQDAVVQIGEIALFDLVRTLSRSPRFPAIRRKALNVAHGYTKGGYVHTTQYGSSRQEWDLDLSHMDRGTDFSYIWDDVDTYTTFKRPFWLSDQYYNSTTGFDGYMIHIPEDELEGGAVERDLQNLALRVRES